MFGNPDAQVVLQTQTAASWPSYVEAITRFYEHFLDRLAEELATYYNVGATTSSEVNFKNFGQMDLVMISVDDLDVVHDICSYLQLPLASHHFLIIVALQIPFGHAACHDVPLKQNLIALL